jgi:DNA-binding NarL/FixJ family response regulator
MMMAIPDKKPRIIVADDNANVLLTLVSALSKDFDVVATATDGRSALTYIQQLQPCVAVLDLNMPEMSGIEVTREIMRLRLACMVVICSVESDLELISAAQLAGALGYVLKRRLHKDLVAAVKRAASGEGFFFNSEPTRPRISR